MTTENPAPETLPMSTTTTVDTLIASCHCGQIQVQIPAKPTKLNECHCTVCYKYGALWGYFPRREVVVTIAGDAKSQAYIRTDEGADGDISFNRCGNCGCMVFWLGVGEFAGPEHDMGVNCRMLPEKEIEGIPKKVSKGPGNC